MNRPVAHSWNRSLEGAGLALLLVATVALSSVSTFRGNIPQVIAAKSEEPTFPTNPFYNPGPCASCTTSFQYIANGHPGIQTQSASIGSCGGPCNGLFIVSAGTLYDPVGMVGEAVVYNDCLGIICGINLATWSLKLPSGIPDACVPNIPSASERRRQVCPKERSEEHTSELQSLAYLVCRLLLEKKKIKPNTEEHATRIQEH